MGKLKEFLKRKDVVFSAHRYGIDAMGAMAQGLFASLLIITFGAIILVLYIFIKDKEFLSDGPKKDKTDDADAEH